MLDKLHLTKNMRVEEATEVSDLLETCKGLSPTDKSKCVTALMAVATDDSLGRDFGAQPTKYLGNGLSPMRSICSKWRKGIVPSTKSTTTSIIISLRMDGHKLQMGLSPCSSVSHPW